MSSPETDVRMYVTCHSSIKNNQSGRDEGTKRRSNNNNNVLANCKISKIVSKIQETPRCPPYGEHVICDKNYYLKKEKNYSAFKATINRKNRQRTTRTNGRSDHKQEIDNLQTNQLN